MCRLDELINELCPDGVKYYPFGKIATILRGASPRPIKNFITDSQSGISWIKIGDIKTGNKYVQETKEKITKEGATKSRFVKKGDFILSNSMSFGRPYILNIDGCIHDGWLSISDFENDFTSDFLYHLLSSHKLQEEMRKKASFGGAVQNLNADIVKALVLPVPPLPVQEEIVRVLDNFSELTAELSENLTEELTARKQQYEYYRDSLLTFGDEVEWKPLGELCEVITKGTTPKSYESIGVSFVKTESFQNGHINKAKLSYVSDEVHNGFLKRSILKEHDILFTIAGATIGKTAVVTCDILPANTNQALAIIRLKDKSNLKFILFLFQSKLMTKYIEKSVKGSAQPNLNLQQMSEFPVPILSSPEKQCIVAILDRFDSLCNDMSEGLPAEIKARQQQYEYYRDKLLTFKEKEVCADE